MPPPAAHARQAAGASLHSPRREQVRPAAARRARVRLPQQALRPARRDEAAAIAGLSSPLLSSSLLSSSHLLLSRRAEQAKDLAELILGCGPLPEPEADPEAFLAALTRAQAEVPAVFHPIKGSAQPWFNVQKFGKMLKGGGGECVLC